MSEAPTTITRVSAEVPLHPRLAALGEWWREPDTWTVFLGHGTRDPEGAREFLTLVDGLRAARPGAHVETGALEFYGPVVPSIQSAFDRAVESGARRIVAQPVLLFEAGHARRDMPRQIERARQRHPGVEFTLGRHVGVHPALLDLLRARADEVEALLGPRDGRPTALLVVGRGTTDARANAAVYEVARLLWEAGDWDLSEVCFSGVAPPDPAAGMRRCLQLGARRVLAVPMLVNTGILLRRVRDQADAVAREVPGAEIAVARHFGVDARLIDLLWERAARALAGGCPRHRFQLPARVKWDPERYGAAGHTHGHSHGDEAADGPNPQPLPYQGRGVVVGAAAATEPPPSLTGKGAGGLGPSLGFSPAALGLLPAEDDHAQADHGDPNAWVRGEARWHEF